MSISNLIDYVSKHALRGTCRCGKCCDLSREYDPPGHTVDLVFFLVSNDEGDASELKALVQSARKGEYCDVDLFDGKEHSFIELGAWIGDQGIAMMLMGLGTILGLWRLMTPKMLGLPDDLVMQMAGSGLVTIQA